MLKEDAETNQMSRALLTNGERDAIRDDPEMDSSTKSSHLSRVRAKVGKLEEDARLLREYRPELYEEVRDAVVEENSTSGSSGLNEKWSSCARPWTTRQATRTEGNH